MDLPHGFGPVGPAHPRRLWLIVLGIHFKLRDANFQELSRCSVQLGPFAQLTGSASRYSRFCDAIAQRQAPASATTWHIDQGSRAHRAGLDELHCRGVVNGIHSQVKRECQRSIIALQPKNN